MKSSVIILSSIQVLMLILILAWPISFFMVAFMFDEPGSMNVFTIVLASSFFLYPVPIILGNVLFWVNKKKADIKKLVTYTILSSSGPVFVVLFFMLLELACNGKFSCN